jgi:acyl transferase domain-containing protein
VNLILHPDTTAMFQRAGMLSPVGRCKALDASADGYVRAEGCGALLLASEQELVLGSPSGGVEGALAWLAGGAVNQDGRSSALTAPNGPAQQEVIRGALAAAGVAAASMAALSMHGTGEARLELVLMSGRDDDDDG